MAEETDSGELPRFAHSLLGYDRYQVEEYVGRLQEWADDLEARLEAAQRQIEIREEEVRAVRARQKIIEDYEDHPTDTVSAVLITTLEELNRLRENAAAESGRVLEAAKEEALAVVRAAREMAEDVVRRAQAEPRRIEGEAEGRLRRAKEEAEALQRRLSESRPDAGDQRASVERSLLDLSSMMADVTKRLDEMGHELDGAHPAGGATS
jgi:cell division septum initiation protein DivIVA